MKIISLIMPEYGQITPPANIPSGGSNFLTETLIPVAIDILLITALVISLFFLISSGIQWSSSGGDKQAIQKARNRITFAIIGLVVVLISFLIIGIVSAFFQVNLLNPQLPQ